MHGGVRRGYGACHAERRGMRADPASCRAVLSAPWDITITPLNTCGLIQLKGENYARPTHRPTPSYKRCWRLPGLDGCTGRRGERPFAGHSGTTLFDCVAVYLAITQDP